MFNGQEKGRERQRGIRQVSMGSMGLCKIHTDKKNVRTDLAVVICNKKKTVDG